jgi:hypothetical protein
MDNELQQPQSLNLKAELCKDKKYSSYMFQK